MTIYKVPELEEFQFQPSVKDQHLSSPPAAVKGDRYIVASTGSGLWSGKTGYIATYNSSTWDFVTPRVGMLVWVEDESRYYKYTGGIWVADIGPTGTTGAVGTTGATGTTGAIGTTGASGGTTIILKVLSDSELLATGDGQMYFTIPSALNGLNFIEVAAHVYTASTSGLPTININNTTLGQDVLSTRITIDANKTDSSTAATPPVINTSYDNVTTADVIRIDCDVTGTGTKGLELRLKFG